MQHNQKPSNIQLFLAFFRLGITAFGGPSMVAYVRKLAVEKKGCVDEGVFSDGVALCQMIPGATAMQSTAYVGLKVRGATGAFAAFVGFGLPAFLLMTILAALYAYGHSLPVVLSAFSGLQAIIVAIVANAAITFGKNTLRRWQAFLIAAGAATLFGLSVNPIIVILLAAISGLVLVEKKSPNPKSSPGLDQTRHFGKAILLIVTIAALSLSLLFVFNRTLFNLAVLLIRIDLFAFGGGFASVPLMFHEIVHVRHWLDGQTFMNGIVLGQVTPGPIVITATFIGYVLAGLSGAVVATISIFLPSFLLVLGITPYFDRLRAWPPFSPIIGGVLCSFVGLLATVTARFSLDVPWDVSHILLATGALIALLKKIDILWVVVVGTVLSIMIFP